MGYCAKPGHGNYIGINCPKCSAGPRPVVQPVRLPVAPKVAVPNPVQVKVPTIHFDRIPMLDNKVGAQRKSDWDTYFRPHYTDPNAAMENIKKLLGKYWQIFSPIARSNFNPYLRNTLTDLQKEVSTWMGIKKPNDPLNPAMVALKEVADRTLKAMPVPLPRRYQSVVCIGYKVITDNFEWVDAAKNFRVKYEGAWADREDMKDKRDQLQEVIKKALAEYRTKFSALSLAEHNETLKIFMAPEFYFCGKQGGYDMAVVGEILPQMRVFTKADDYKHWLFVLGTAIGATRLHTQCPTLNCGGETEVMNDPKNPLSHRNVLYCRKCKQYDLRPPEMMLDNFALIQKGGENTGANEYLILKENMSHVDYRRPNPSTDWDSPNPTPADREVEVRGLIAQAIPSLGSRQSGSVAPSKYDDERMGGSVFTMDGIRFGVEVCRDHLVGRLAASNNTSPMNIQIQLIPSAGVPNPEDQYIVAPIVFNVDGGLSCKKVLVRKNGTYVPLTPKGDLFISDRIPIS